MPAGDDEEKMLVRKMWTIAKNPGCLEPSRPP
jgi:hypothetical protein